jgi:hypothetical protein
VALPTDALQPARGGNLFMIGKMEARVPAAPAAPPAQPSAQSPAQSSAFQLK